MEVGDTISILQIKSIEVGVGKIIYPRSLKYVTVRADTQIRASDSKIALFALYMLLPNKVYMGGRGGRGAYKEVGCVCQAWGWFGVVAAGLRNVCAAPGILAGMLSPSGVTTCCCLGL